MHAIHRLGVIAACALSLTGAPTFARTQAPTQPVAVPAAIDSTDDEATIIASARWRDLVTLMHEIGYHGPVDEAAMVAACHEALARLHAGGTQPHGVSAADECVSSALWSWDSSLSYFPASSTANNRRNVDHHIIGIGAEMGRQASHGPIRIVSLLAEGAAERAGVRAGDRIVRVDGQAVAQLSIEKAIARIRGTPGSVVRLQVERGVSRQALSIDVVRERIHEVNVKRLPGTPRIAVLRIIWLADDTMADLARHVSEILRSGAPAPDTLVVDLRDCRGGNLDAALQVGGAFSTDGTIVTRELTHNGELALTAATSAEPHVPFPVAARQWLAEARIAVLVDATTAEDAEALAQFLREQRGARMFGTPTYGLAGVRTLVNLGDDVQVRIRTGDLISSRRVAWDGVGLVPDVALPAAPLQLPGSKFFGSPADTALALALRSLETPSGGAGAAGDDRSGGGGEAGGGAGPNAQ